MFEDKRLEEQMLKYEFALKMLETELGILLDEYRYKNKYNPVEYTKSRIKTLDSATRKLVSRNYNLTVENLVEHVHDMVGYRIICSFLSDVDDIVKVIKSSKQLKVFQEKNYIHNPKESGYLSYHILAKLPIYLNGHTEDVEVEIQIRTIAMDFWASLDHKIRYKFDDDIPDEVIEEMYNCSEVIQDLDLKMEKMNTIMNKYKK